MWKVVIVDDEVIVRRGLIHTIAWEKYGMVVVADYPNGQKAFEDLNNVKPDVVLTDIRMPHMDGLELLQYIKNEHPEVITLILSCHNDFEYAKSAMLSGAVDYLLKTAMDEQEIDRAMARVQQLLQDRKQKVQMLQKIETSRWFERQAVLRAVLKHRAATEDEMRGCQWPHGGQYWLIAARTFNGDHAEQMYVKLNYLRERDGEESELICGIDVESYIVLLLYTNRCLSVMEAQERHQIWANRLYSMLDDPQAELYVGVAQPVEVFDQLADAFKQAQSGEEQFFYNTESKAFYTPSIAQEAWRSQSLFSSEERQRLLEAVASKSVGEVGRIVKQLMDKWELGIPSKEIKAIAVVIIDVLRSSRTTMQGKFRSASLDVSELYKLHQLETLMGEELQFWEQDQTQASAYHTIRPEIQQAIQYIQVHLGDVLKMNTVAEHVQLSRSHFSALFKQELGKTFLEYVLEQKMDKAKEKLKYSPHKFYEIANEVGFSDYKYFTRCFKEYTGMTPKEWREGYRISN